ncbi:hypothetical protein [Gynuella sunshinyii]|uniref:ABC-type multidrug transport system, permease component n=1 Tax=Gynuella sunshinyii YC6258 TaxID=1445510 RepID=A0A0C5VZE0_9GAMM|nr:hypothetical protein [Gynuella sunshinyii]AJQ95769.1 hypothetical Protein YC6258_03733 [Gynuella sunshinyii YC6258]DAC80068.1 TPA_exp: hypothetical protein [Gynuella sunshinyii YC6258]
MVITQIFKTDAKRIISDSFMVFMYIAPWVTALIVKAAWVYSGQHYPDIALQQYAWITTLAIALLTPMNMGIVLGFQLLEEKEQGVFRAIAVTPLNNDRYLYYRFVITAIIAIVMTYFVHQLLGLVSINAISLLLLVCVAAWQIPLQALMIAGIARNTLEGFAMMKSTGFMLLVPMLVLYFFAASKLSWIAGIFPFFWVIKAYQYGLAEQTAPFMACLVTGLVYSWVICWVLLKRYRSNALK